AEIARAGIVDTGIVDLVENAVAQSEPHAAFDRGRGADSALRARGPARGNAWISGRWITTARSHAGAPSKRTGRADVAGPAPLSFSAQDFGPACLEHTASLLE